MQHHRRLLTYLLFAVSGLGTGWWLASTTLQRATRESLPPESASERSGDAVAVTVAPVATRAVQRTVETVGTLFGYEEVMLAATVEGHVRRVARDVSDRVSPGEVLIEIDPTDYELAVRQAERSLQVELAKLGLKELPDKTFDVTRVPSVVQAKARMENAKLRLDRVQKLRLEAASREEIADKAAERRIADAEYDNQILLAETGLAGIWMRQEALGIAQQQLKETLIRVPAPTQPVPGGDEVTYVVCKRAVAEGTFVRAGVEVAQLVIDRMLKLRAAVPERFGADLRVGQPVDVTTASHPQALAGTVTRINPAVDSETRTFDVEIQVPNRDGQLKPGSFAKALVQTRLDPDATTVPLEALVTFAGVTKIFLIEADRAVEVQVIPGVQSTEWVEIASPRLPAGAQVVTSGQTALASGSQVSVRQQAVQAALPQAESASR